MKSLILGLAVGMLASAADESAVTAIKQMVERNFQSIRDARSNEDLLRAVDEMDSPDWVSELPDGQTWTRVDALRELRPILTIPPEKRGSPLISYIYWHETASEVSDVYWVYQERNGDLTGSIARDTWRRTSLGWRRTRHLKFFPDRPIVAGGKPVVLPPARQ